MLKDAATQSIDVSINEGFQTLQETVFFAVDIWMGESNRPEPNKKQKESYLDLEYFSLFLDVSICILLHK